MILSLMFFAFYATARSGNASAAGEVIVLNKADFLAKVFNYEVADRRASCRERV